MCRRFMKKAIREKKTNRAEWGLGRAPRVGESQVRGGLKGDWSKYISSS